MALMTMSELRELSMEGLEERLKQLRDDLMHERGQAAMGGAPASPGKIRQIRKNIARIKTIQREAKE